MFVTRGQNESVDVIAPGCTEAPRLEEFDWSDRTASQQENTAPIDVLSIDRAREIRGWGRWLARWVSQYSKRCPLNRNPLHQRGGGR